MADFQIKVTAETQKAAQDLQRLDKTANDATKDRSIKIDVPSIGTVSKNFKDLSKNLSDAANDIKKFYGIAKQLPGIGDQIKTYENALASTVKTTNALANNTKAGDIIAHSFEKATSTVGVLVSNLAKVGFALFGLKEIVGVLQTAFGGFFNETIAREIRLRETILKTQTTLASTNKVFRNGTEITDPYQKIVALTGQVAKHIDSIRERSIALAGVTSNDVIEVFGIVASQVGQIGGGMKEAEDLAINFAAALGTFGIPLYQARQEIGSILRGDITTDSYLAKALGITNEDVAKAKSQAGGVVKFLEDRLAAAVAGQKIAAQGFSGIVSNIKDLYELVGQRFGAQLLDPLLNALAATFENLFKIKDQLFAIADTAGAALGRVAAIGQELRSRAGLVSLGEIGLKDNSGQKVLNNIKDAVQDVTVLVEGAAQRAIGAVAQAITTLKPSVITVADAFMRLGKVFIEIKVNTFESLARVVANLLTAATPLLAVFTTLFNLYSRFLDLPVIKEFAKLATTMAVLKRAGMDFITNLILVGNTMVTVVIPALGRLGAAFGFVIGGIGAIVLAIGKLTLSLAGLTASLAGIPGIAVGVAQALLTVSKNLDTTGQTSVNTSKKLDTVAGGFKNLGETAKLAGFNIIKSLGWTFLIQAAITVAVNALGEYQKASEDIARQKRAELALERLSGVYRNVGDDADYATKSARDFERQLAQGEYNRATERLEEIRKKMNELRYEAQFGIQTWGEFFKLFDLRRTLLSAQGLRPDSVEAGKLLAEEIRLRDYRRKYEAQQNKKDIADNIKIEAQNRINLEKEIKDLQRQHQNELFQQRQALAQKEVEIFRATGELRIQQMERANKKLIEGEEGASRTALEALNNYLSTRERGELEIEAAKKSLAIEVANMEQRIADYRFDIEKKIFDLRKRAGENDVKSAQLRRQQIEASAHIVTGGPVKGGAVVTQRNDPDGEQTGSDIALKGGIGAPIQNPFSSLRITQVGKQGHGSGDTGRGFGNYITGVAELNGQKFEVLLGHLNQVAVRMGEVLQSGAVIGTQGISGHATGPHVSTHVNALNGGNASAVLSAIENAWVKGGTIQSRSMGAAAQVQPLKDRQDIGTGAQEAQEYATAVRNVASAMGRLQTLQAALTNAKTKEAFDAVAESIFQPVGLENLRDQLNEVQLNYQAIATASAAAFNPERTAIEVATQVKMATATRERGQIEKYINDSTQLQATEKAKLLTDINLRQQKYLESLRQEESLQKAILAVKQGADLVQRFRTDTINIYRELEATRLRNRLEAEGVAPEKITAELAKLRIRQDMKDTQRLLNEQLTEELRLLKEKQAALATSKDDKEKTALQERIKQLEETIRQLRKQLEDLPKEGQGLADAIDAQAKEKPDPVKSLIGRWKLELSDTRTMIASLAQTMQSELGNAMSSAITGVINGTQTVAQAFGQMFQNIGKAFIDMATQMIAKALIMKVLGILAGGSGGFAGVTGSAGAFGNISGAAAGFPSLTEGAANAGWIGLPMRAAGGPVTANQPYIVGENGPELFSPSSNGTIFSNSRLRESMAGAPSSSSSSSPILQMSFQTTTINGVEYVSRDQLESAMEETRRLATRDGANRGMAQTLDRLRNSSSTRRRTGIR